MPDRRGSYKPDKVKVTQHTPPIVQPTMQYNQQGRLVPGPTYVTPGQKQTVTYKFSDDRRAATDDNRSRAFLEAPAAPSAPARSSSRRISQWADDVARETRHNGSVNSVDRQSDYSASSSRRGPKTSKSSSMGTASVARSRSHASSSTVAPSQLGNLGAAYNPTVSYQPSAASMRSGSQAASVSGGSMLSGGRSSHRSGSTYYHPQGPGPLPDPYSSNNAQRSYGTPAASSYSQSSYGGGYSPSAHSSSTVRAGKRSGR